MAADGPPSLPRLWPAVRKGDFARKPRDAPVEEDFAFQLAANHGVHQLGAETFPHRRRNARAAGFGPAQRNLVARGSRPLYVDVAIGHQQGSVLGGIGR